MGLPIAEPRLTVPLPYFFSSASMLLPGRRAFSDYSQGKSEAVKEFPPGTGRA